jgi:hypothetical protein
MPWIGGAGGLLAAGSPPDGWKSSYCVEQFAVRGIDAGPAAAFAGGRVASFGAARVPPPCPQDGASFRSGCRLLRVRVRNDPLCQGDVAGRVRAIRLAAPSGLCVYVVNGPGVTAFGLHPWLHSCRPCQGSGKCRRLGGRGRGAGALVARPGHTRATNSNSMMPADAAVWRRAVSPLGAGSPHFGHSGWRPRRRMCSDPAVSRGSRFAGSHPTAKS